MVTLKEVDCSVHSTFELLPVSACQIDQTSVILPVADVKVLLLEYSNLIWVEHCILYSTGELSSPPGQDRSSCCCTSHGHKNPVVGSIITGNRI